MDLTETADMMEESVETVAEPFDLTDTFYNDSVEAVAEPFDLSDLMHSIMTWKTDSVEAVAESIM